MRTDQRLTTAMGESLRHHGYAGTAIKQVIVAAGAPNGSLYHHFSGGKRELATRALREMGQAYAELVGGLLGDGLFGDGGADLPAVIESAFEAAAADIERNNWINMCPVGTVAGEVADTEPELRVVAAEIFDAWILTGAMLFEARGLRADDARTLTVALIAGLEGAFVLARTLRSGEPLIAAGRSVAALAATLHPVDENQRPLDENQRSLDG